MIVATIQVGKIKPEMEDVEAAVSNAGREPPFEVTIDHDDRWSFESFNLFLGRWFDTSAFHYHTWGRAGKLAQLVTEQTGGTVEYTEQPPLEEGEVP